MGDSGSNHGLHENGHGEVTVTAADGPSCAAVNNGAAKPQCEQQEGNHNHANGAVVSGGPALAPVNGSGSAVAGPGPDVNRKRENYLSWNDYFMAVAFLSAMRSKDPVTQVGACIVNKENKIVGIGYNGMPIGCSDDEFPWQKQSENPIENKYLYVCHAELNSILNKIVGELNGCRIYVAMFPCNECAKLIIQSGIREVIYLSNKNWTKVECAASKRMFDASGVLYTQYIPTSKKIVIDFESIDWNKMSQMPATPKKTRTE